MSKVDPVTLSVFQSAMHSIAEEMGAALRRTAISPNIKERRDYSCAVFDAQHRVIAMGDHMPVHLGSMPMSVEAAISSLRLGRGDIALLNDPYAGGTHLPDLTMVMPVFRSQETRPTFYVAARAHHADVGGSFPGSMGPGSSIFQEGLRIPPIRLVRSGEMDDDLLTLLLLNVRTPGEREGDLAAQCGACRVGEQRLLQMMERHSAETIPDLCDALLDYSERLVRARLRTLPSGVYPGQDFLDPNNEPVDGDVSRFADPIRIAVALTINSEDGSLTADFTGSAPQVPGSLNAVRAITLSACFYVLRCLIDDDAPATAGILRPLMLVLPEASIVNAHPPAAVAGGNVETSQRIVDTLLRALAAAAPNLIPAASAGTMSNLTIGGMDSRTSQPYTYYETTAGGMGAGPDRDGLPGVQTHMTNSLNTPVEALEFAYPLRVHRYSYRADSGGNGLHRGGDGLIKELELLDDASVTLLADRHQIAPYGLAGGEPGVCGSITQTPPGAVPSGAQTGALPARFSRTLPKGTVIRLETPGGGGWGGKP